MLLIIYLLTYCLQLPSVNSVAGYVGVAVVGFTSTLRIVSQAGDDFHSQSFDWCERRNLLNRSLG